jgi:hypothetical protein
LLDQLFVRNELLATLQHALEADDSLLVDDEIRALRELPLAVVYAVRLNRFQVRRIAEQREIELQIIGESFLRERDVRADADDLRIDCSELRIVVPTGRQFAYSGGGEIEHVKLNNDVFLTDVVAQLELAGLRTRQLEVGGFLAYFKRRSEAGRERENSGSHQGEGGFGHAVSFHKG